MDSLSRLEWPALFQALLNRCETPYGVRSWQATPFLDAPHEQLYAIATLQAHLLRVGDPLLSGPIPDVADALSLVDKGGVLTGEALGRLLSTLTHGQSLLFHLTQPGPDVGLLATHLAQHITEDGGLLESASPVLAKLRHQERSLRTDIQRRLDSLIGQLATALQSANYTQRDGRFVLPVRAEKRAQVRGVVHGASGTGGTLFIEPESLLPLNNKLRTLEADIDVEVQRLLSLLSAWVQSHQEAITEFLEAVAQADRLLAGARLSRALGATVPTVADTSMIALKQARHPLLVLQGVDVIANDVTLGGDDIKTLLITGPNTGGKTVLLKTLGLCALMLRAGLPLPVDEGSTLSLFDPVCVDIGDEQSLVESLSTFSARLTHVKGFLAQDLSRALVLIDEIGAGTDPAEGAALAQALLEAFYEAGALTVVTTHLGELKLVAHGHPGFQNASVLFNPDTLGPTYQLLQGVPGASHALHIAQRLGLPDAVLTRARHVMSAPARDTAALLEELEHRQRTLDAKLKETEAFRLAAEEAHAQVDELRNDLLQQRRRIAQELKFQLKGQLRELQSRIKVLRERVEKEETRTDKLRQVEKHLEQRIDQVFEPHEVMPATPPPPGLKPGDVVFSRRMNLTGTVISVSAKDAVLEAGVMKMTLPLTDLEKTRGRKPPKVKEMPAAAFVPEVKSAHRECDVRGQRVETALEEVALFLDTATLAGLEQVDIIHGLGTGALKEAVRSLLKEHPQVKGFHPAPAVEGGDGKTVVLFKS